MAHQMVPGMEGLSKAFAGTDLDHSDMFKVQGSMGHLIGNLNFIQ
jgi:hypothetical protein